MLLAVGVLVLLPAIALWLRFYDPKLSADATAVELRQELNALHSFRCTSLDASIVMSDVDYVCFVRLGSDPTYWVGTDRREITEIQRIP